MKNYLMILLFAAATAGGTKALFAAESISTTKDLTAVIALHALPCGQVTTAVRQGDNDYLATCQDGNRYRVYVNSEGRVVVQKQ